jgi:hypothetical protein
MLTDDEHTLNQPLKQPQCKVIGDRQLGCVCVCVYLYFFVVWREGEGKGVRVRERGKKMQCAGRPWISVFCSV